MLCCEVVKKTFKKKEEMVMTDADKENFRTTTQYKLCERELIKRQAGGSLPHDWQINGRNSQGNKLALLGRCQC